MGTDVNAKRTYGCTALHGAVSHGGKGRPRAVAISKPKSKRIHIATAALETKLQEAKSVKKFECPPAFFTEPLED